MFKCHVIFTLGFFYGEFSIPFLIITFLPSRFRLENVERYTMISHELFGYSSSRRLKGHMISSRSSYGDCSKLSKCRDPGLK
jgi:hypothetical protein